VSPSLTPCLPAGFLHAHIHARLMRPRSLRIAAFGRMSHWRQLASKTVIALAHLAPAQQERRRHHCAMQRRPQQQRRRRHAAALLRRRSRPRKLLHTGCAHHMRQTSAVHCAMSVLAFMPPVSHTFIRSSMCCATPICRPSSPPQQSPPAAVAAAVLLLLSLQASPPTTLQQSRIRGVMRVVAAAAPRRCLDVQAAADTTLQLPQPVQRRQRAAAQRCH
jgi:hypothetical protein